MKEKLNVAEQIQNLKSKGLSFDIVDEKDAEQMCIRDRLNIISKVVKDYYHKTKSLPVFGEITGFKLYLLGKNYSLDTNGNFTDKEIAEQVATIKF